MLLSRIRRDGFTKLIETPLRSRGRKDMERSASANQKNVKSLNIFAIKRVIIVSGPSRKNLLRCSTDMASSMTSVICGIDSRLCRTFGAPGNLVECQYHALTDVAIDCRPCGPR